MVRLSLASARAATSEPAPGLLRSVTLGDAASSLAPYLGEIGARLYLLRELLAGAIASTALAYHIEHTFLGPNPPTIARDEAVPTGFWRLDWSHDGEVTEVTAQGGWPTKTTRSANWEASTFAFVATWGRPERAFRQCKRASGVSICKADHRRLLTLFSEPYEADRQSRGSQADAVQWCLDYIIERRGRNSAEAFIQFGAEPRFEDVSRDAFRLAWKEAKDLKDG